MGEKWASAYTLYGEGRIAEALQVANPVIASQTADAGLLNLAAICHQRLGDSEQAISCWRQALQSKPDFADAHYNLGNLLNKLRRFQEAEGSYRQALCYKPDHAEAYNNLGVVLNTMRAFVEAEAALRQAIALRPNYVDPLKNLGILLSGLKRYEEAVIIYQKLLQLKPDHVQVTNNMGVILTTMRRYEEAEVAFRDALRLDPDFAEVYNNLGNLLSLLNRPEETEMAYRHALRLKPDYAQACNNLGNFLGNMKRFTEAESFYRKALSMVPDYEEAQFHLGLLLLSLGRLTEGWPLHEVRQALHLKERNVHATVVPYPRWNGEDIRGKSLMILPEQGFGDQIQFCRYVTLLKAMGARHITLVCEPALVTLFTSVRGVDCVVKHQEAMISHPDFWTHSLSLPYHLGTTLQSIPHDIPYLYPAHDKKTYWDQHLPKGEFLVGLVWKGDSTHKNDAKRSLPNLPIYAPLWTVPGVIFISLQKGCGEVEAMHPPPSQPIVPMGQLIDDFADTAAIISHLDLVISIDSAVAHLAGALGKPCWVLLPAWNTDWRWLQERRDSPWYPGVMRLFRQTKPDDWSEVVRQLVDELAILSCIERKSLYNNLMV
ncbi:MAG: glycosyltransferase family protein [Magnetococcales bacterium]|nr:glycosyltransferase family protein [Magnetococcales bacterium]